MSQDWGSLPLLPLRCILEYLSTEEAMAAMSTCRHWRTAMLLYEGRKETMKLNARYLEKNLFLTRVFRKHTRKLHVYLDCNEEQLENFINHVLPQFFDAVNLQEIIFIGPNYLQLSYHVPVKLKRIITETLIFKHLQSIKRLAFIGCEMANVKNEDERYAHRHVEYYSKPLLFNTALTAADAVLSRSNARMMVLSTLQHIIVDYDHINTEALESLAHLSNFSHLTFNVCQKRPLILRPIQWRRLNALYAGRLHVTVNIIGLKYKRFDDVIDNVLVEEMPLTSLKVMFCKTIYGPILEHLARVHKETLCELVWVDAPYESADGSRRLMRVHRPDNLEIYHVNPFILLCWQCVRLERLVIHGYWLWQYDVEGFARLRRTLRALDVSAIYDRRSRLLPAAASPPAALRVLRGDEPPQPSPLYINQVNEFTEFKWQPIPCSKLHPGLRARSTAEQRMDYILYEMRRPSPLGVT